MSSFVLKMIAAVSMFIDHMGLILFPRVNLFRIIGRLAFPLYAFSIAEGFKYTRNRLKYFLRVFVLGILCQIVYTIVDGVLYLGILITFSFSIVLMFFADSAKKAMRGEKSPVSSFVQKLGLGENCDKPISVSLFAAATLICFILCRAVEVDYGFFGILLPVLVSIPEKKESRLLAYTAGVVAVIAANTSFGVQIYSLFTIPLVLLYNGKPGKYRMKYFFYIFYPLHLVVLYGIGMLM